MSEHAHINPHIVRLVGISRPPYLFQQLFMRNHFAGVFDEICKQPVFDRRKVDFRLFQEYAAFSKIDAQGVLDEDRLCLTLLANSSPALNGFVR